MNVSAATPSPWLLYQQHLAVTNELAGLPFSELVTDFCCYHLDMCCCNHSCHGNQLLQNLEQCLKHDVTCRADSSWSVNLTNSSMVFTCWAWV